MSTLRGPWRAAFALALHIGFFALPIGLVAGLLAIAVFTFGYDRGSGLRVALVALVVGAVLGVGMRAVLRSRNRPRGVALSRSEHPQLWKAVDAICSAAHTAAPDEIRVTSEPNAFVREDTALLGLRTRARYLEVGLPLLAGLTASELRAVLAHEIGHLAARGRLTAMAYRASTSVERAASDLTGGPTKWLFGGYARLYSAAAGSTSPDLELAADAVAVRVTGKRAAVTALRKATAIEFGWREYAESYLSMAVSVERTPDVLLGFRAFMENSVRKPKLAERAKQAIAAESAGDSGHPTTRERIAAMKRMSGADKELDDRPAFALLRNPRKSVPVLEDRLLVDGLGPRMPWPELARLAGAEHVAHQASLLSSAVAQSGITTDPAIGGVLQAVHRGEGPDLVNPVLNPGLAPDRIAEAAVDTLTELLGGAVVDALVSAGRAHHELDWAGPSVVRLTNGRPLDPDRLVRPAVADPRLVPGLHRALVDLGVPLNHSRPPAEEPEASVAGLVSPVELAGSRYDMVVTDRGLVLLPTTASTAQRLLAGAVARAGRAERKQLAELAATPVAELRERRDAQWVDSRDVASARLLQERRGWTLVLDLYLDEYAVSSLDEGSVAPDADGAASAELRSTPDSMEHGDPYSGLGELMGARMDIDDQRDLTEE
ncbi:M48 family metallopeptidase [Saccharopolyspora erythraea]|uniref:M48 family metallopeptidase n=1 Tax=Saccharopolyspora erythraea TaxID=1836 RepID=UPI001E44CCB7|nr:M48 family metallopeptidase [Saccharopolyspora erythraea]